MSDRARMHRSGGFLFQLDEERADSLLRDVLPDLFDPPGAETVKTNLARTVYRASFSGETLYVKRYHVRGPKEWLKYLLVPSRARAEWRASRQLVGAGLPTARAVLMGERRRLGVLRDAVLASEEVPGAVPLVPWVREHLPGPGNVAARRGLLGDLARLIRRFHDAGFVHGDLHGGNLPVSGGPAEPRITILDLHTVRRRGRVGRRARIENLAKLVHSLRLITSGPDRLRLLRAYEGEAPVLGSAGDVARTIFARAVRLERRRLRSRSERCVRRSSSFDLDRAGRFRLYRRREVPEWAPMHVVGDHLLSVWRARPEVLKDSNRSALSRQLLPGLPELAGVVVKETKSRGVVDVLKNVFRRHRGLASWRNGNALLVHGVGAARPLALVVEGRWPLIGPSWLVMEDLGRGERLDLFVLKRHAGNLTSAERAEKLRLVRAFGRFVGDLHARGIYHGDLKAVNIFVEQVAGGGFAFKLVDYDRVQFLRRVSRRRRIKNLAQIAASVAVLITRTDRLRFFRAWASEEGDLAEGRVYGRGVERLCRRKIVVRMEPIE